MLDLFLGQGLVGTKVTLVLEYPLIMFSLATPIGGTQYRSLMAECCFLVAIFLNCFSYNPGKSAEPQVSCPSFSLWEDPVYRDKLGAEKDKPRAHLASSESNNAHLPAILLCHRMQSEKREASQKQMLLRR